MWTDLAYHTTTLPLLRKSALVASFFTSTPQIPPRWDLAALHFLVFCDAVLKIMSRKSDVESQWKDENGPLFQAASIDSKYRPTTTKFAYLAVYFLCNVSLTIYNKAVLGKVFTSFFLSFSFPLLFSILRAFEIAERNWQNSSSHTHGYSQPSTLAAHRLDAMCCCWGGRLVFRNWTIRKISPWWCSRFCSRLILQSRTSACM